VCQIISTGKILFNTFPSPINNFFLKPLASLQNRVSTFLKTWNRNFHIHRYWVWRNQFKCWQRSDFLFKRATTSMFLRTTKLLESGHYDQRTYERGYRHRSAVSKPSWRDVRILTNRVSTPIALTLFWRLITCWNLRAIFHPTHIHTRTHAHTLCAYPSHVSATGLWGTRPQHWQWDNSGASTALMLNPSRQVLGFHLKIGHDNFHIIFNI
jgi:hypothetical protein